MIIKSAKAPFTVDLGRPSLMSPEAIKRWKAIHDWVKSTNTRVAVGRAFYQVDRFIQRDEFYQGGGMHYVFGFGNLEDKEKFVAVVNQAIADFPPPA